MLVAARARWRVPGDRLAAFGCHCAMTTGHAGAVRRYNRALLPTVGWSLVVGELVLVPTVMTQSISNSLGLISAGWLELRWWRNPPPATERQHVASSLERRLAILCGGLERCSLEGALVAVGRCCTARIGAEGAHPSRLLRL